MKLHLTDLPEDPHARTQWLEQVIVGADFGDILTELAVLAEGRGELNQPLAAVVGSARDAVLQKGLSVLSPSQINSLLQSPDALLELQEEVLLEGGPWWQQQLQPAEPNSRAENAPNHSVAKNSTKSPWTAIIGGLVTLAAAVTLVVWLNGLKAPDANWGWAAPSALAHAEPPQYLRQLASGAEQWFDKRPASRPRLKQRLAELSAGCQRLIDAEHEPLSSDDRQWLVERCQKWKDKFDSALATLAHEADVQTVRDEVDAVVDKLATTLRQRADELETA